MKATIFNASKTTTKYPNSPYGDKTFQFESIDINSISEVFNYLTTNFVLNIPLIKNTRQRRYKDDLKKYFQPKLDYIILDIDDIDTLSDRELAIKFFRDNKYECILGESRTDYRIKGVLKVNRCSQAEGKRILIEIGKQVPGKMDASSLNYASYQAPVLKNVLLYQGGDRPYPTPVIDSKVAVKATRVEGIEQLCQDELHKLGFSFDKPIQNGYTCSHPSEVKTKGGFTWNIEFPFLMSHWNQARNVSVWELVIKLPQYKKLQKEQSHQAVKDIIPKHLSTTNERYLGTNTKTVKEFLDSKQILKISSPMGTAKSDVIEEVIHQARKKGLRILFLANRISLANDIEKKYDNVKSYTGTQLEGNDYQVGDDLVVQIDSLWKFSTKIFDIVIMDEFTTTMTHLLSLEKNQSKITKQIFSFSKKKMVIADAFIFDEMVSVFSKGNKGIVSINNGYRDDLDLKFFTNKDYFIYEMLQETSPITFSSGSTNTMKIVQMVAEGQGKKVITISADTPQEDKKLIYKMISKKGKANYDILMYSPSLTVGVSNENEIGTHYHLDQGLSMNVLSSVQMVKRTRTADTIKFHLGETIEYNPTDLAIIQESMTRFNEDDDDGDSIGISEAGFKLSKVMRINNILENRHQVAFMELLKLQFKTNGNVEMVKTKVQRPFLAKLSKVIKKRDINTNLSIFEEFKLLTPEEVAEIEYKMFATSKKEELQKTINRIQQDETLQNLSKSQIDLLIEGNIKVPGTLDHYKMILSNKNVVKSNNTYSYSVTDYNLFKKRKIDLQEFGYKKIKKRWCLSPEIVQVITKEPKGKQ